MRNSFKYGDCVGVGVASYERAEMLRGAITSVIQQSYKNLDIHVSDNRSSDPEVLNVLRDLSASDSRVRYTVQEKNLGAFGNFAHLLKDAPTQLFIWLADDDEWAPRFLEGLICEYIRRPAGLIYGTVELFIPGTLPIVQEALEPESRLSELVPSERAAPPKCRPGSAALKFFPDYFNDGVFYGLFPSASGKRHIRLLKPWIIPRFVKRVFPDVENDLVTFPFILALWVESGAGAAEGNEVLHLRRSLRSTGYSPTSNPVRILVLALLHTYLQAAMTKRLCWMIIYSGNVSLLPLTLATSWRIFYRKFRVTRKIRQDKFIT